MFTLQRYSVGTSTSSLLLHLKVEHKIESETNLKSSQIKLTECGILSASTHDTNQRKKQTGSTSYVFARQLALLCARANLPFSLVKVTAFQDFCRYKKINDHEDNSRNGRWAGSQRRF